MATVHEATKITAAELRHHLQVILDRVEHQGESFVIERAGRIIGTIGPPPEPAVGSLHQGKWRRTGVEEWLELWRRLRREQMVEDVLAKLPVLPRTDHHGAARATDDA